MSLSEKELLGTNKSVLGCQCNWERKQSSYLKQQQKWVHLDLLGHFNQGETFSIK